MEIRMIKITEITPYKRNPRDNTAAIQACKESIEEFGFNVPIMLDKKLVVIAGHTRLEAAKLMGLEKVPCYVNMQITPEKARAYRIADNQVGSIAEWNMEMLQLEIQEIEAGPVDLGTLGFTNKQLEDLLCPPDVIPPKEKPEVVEFNTNPSPPSDPFSESTKKYKLGDSILWVGVSRETLLEADEIRMQYAKDFAPDGITWQDFTGESD